MVDPDRPDGEKLAKQARNAAGAAGDKLGGAAGAVTGAAGAAGGKLTGAVGGAGGKLTGAAGAAGGKLTGAVGDAGGKLAGAGGKLGAGAAGVGSLASGGSGRGGWRSYMPPNAKGKVPWRWRWIGVPLLLAACVLTGWWGWDRMEDGLNERALAHLECENVSTDNLNLDWSYRSVTVNGELPSGVTAEQVERIIDNGSTDTSCLTSVADREGFDLDPNADPGVYNVAVPAALAAAAIAVPDAPAPTAVPTATPEPAPTATPEPEPTATPEPEPTAVPQIAALAAAAAYDGQTITLTGEVSSEQQRAALVAAAVASVGEANVIDELTIAEGDPSDTSDARVDEMSATIAAFGGGKVIEGSASITDATHTYDLLSPSDPLAAMIDLTGTGTVRVLEAPAPSFTG